MTNKEKFTEVFGYIPDCGSCNPVNCDMCEWADECPSSRVSPCTDWWKMEYKEPRREALHED